MLQEIRKRWYQFKRDKCWPLLGLLIQPFAHSIPILLQFSKQCALKRPETFFWFPLLFDSTAVQNLLVKSQVRTLRGGPQQPRLPRSSSSVQTPNPEPKTRNPKSVVLPTSSNEGHQSGVLGLEPMKLAKKIAWRS